jgi:preprotein translocase subunit SecE
MAAQNTAVSAAGAPAGKPSLVVRVKDYFDELKAEMRRVTWPAPKQVRATTAVVIASTFLFAAYFAVVDLVLGRAINELFQTLARR